MQPRSNPSDEEVSWRGGGLGLLWKDNNEKPSRNIIDAFFVRKLGWPHA